MASTPNIDILLNLVPDSATTVLTHLRAHPTLASAQDSHGYSLLHAAASYAQLDLARALITEFNVSPNITDEDGETALFNTETVEVATALVELGVDPSLQNGDGQTAEEKLADEEEAPVVAAYLRALAGGDSTLPAGAATTAGPSSTLPPLPSGVHINVGTMQADELGDEPDAEFKRRIEELAARGDFEGEAGQRELRRLIEDAVSGITPDGQGRNTRRRVE